MVFPKFHTICMYFSKTGRGLIFCSSGQVFGIHYSKVQSAFVSITDKWIFIYTWQKAIFTHALLIVDIPEGDRIKPPTFVRDLRLLARVRIPLGPVDHSSRAAAELEWCRKLMYIWEREKIKFYYHMILSRDKWCTNRTERRLVTSHACLHTRRGLRQAACAVCDCWLGFEFRWVRLRLLNHF